MTYQEVYDRLKTGIDLAIKYNVPDKNGSTLIWRINILDIIRYPCYEGCHYSERNPPEYTKPFWNAVLKIARSSQYKDYTFHFNDIRFSFFYRNQFTIQKVTL